MKRAHWPPGSAAWLQQTELWPDAVILLLKVFQYTASLLYTLNFFCTFLNPIGQYYSQWDLKNILKFMQSGSPTVCMMAWVKWFQQDQHITRRRWFRVQTLLAPLALWWIKSAATHWMSFLKHPSLACKIRITLKFWLNTLLNKQWTNRISCLSPLLLKN